MNLKYTWIIWHHSDELRELKNGNKRLFDISWNKFMELRYRFFKSLNISRLLRAICMVKYRYYR